MTLDEAIEHAKQVSIEEADKSLNCDSECAREHWQLAEWLTELKVLRTENVKLRELTESRGWIARMLGEQTARVVALENAEAENARLRELIADGERHLMEILGKNKRLRELVRDYDHCSMYADCDRCEYDGKLSTHCPFSPCFPDPDELHELGVEVDG